MAINNHSTVITIHLKKKTVEFTLLSNTLFCLLHTSSQVTAAIKISSPWGFALCFRAVQSLQYVKKRKKKITTSAVAEFRKSICGSDPDFSPPLTVSTHTQSAYCSNSYITATNRAHIWQEIQRG